VRLRLLEDMKGSGGGTTIELRLPGGRADGVETVAPGMPRFEAGKEQVLLLGKRNAAGYPVLIQASGGVLPLKKDREGRRHLAVPVTGVKELEGAREVSLDAFRSAVKRIVREQAEKAGR
jgi:hypothetical protein